MGFPSPACDYAESRLTIDKICKIDANCHVIETTTGYAVIDRSLTAKQGNTVLISLFDRLHFAQVIGEAMRIDDGQTLRGEELDDVQVKGVVIFTILRT